MQINVQTGVFRSFKKGFQILIICTFLRLFLSEKTPGSRQNIKKRICFVPFGKQPILPDNTKRQEFIARKLMSPC